MDGIGDDVSEAQARAACERILASAVFAKARLMGRLLRHLMEQALCGNARGTTEYAIALEVLGREAASYSPGADPTVRVQMGRLRQRLEAYRSQCAQPGEVLIRIPMGSYRPVIERCAAAPVAKPAPGGALAVQPIQLIAGTADGQAFAQGLQEELLHQMVQAFGPIGVGEAGPRVVVSTLRIDPQRLRATVRVVETAQQRVTWARQFDRAPSFGIDGQEALAAAICEALKQHLALP